MNVNNGAGDPRFRGDSGATRAPGPSTTRSLDVRSLLGGAREIRLLHCQEEYCLRLTRNNKLILTK